jgi:chromosome partitioning protein
MTIITVASSKGGTGKTTTAVTLAARLALLEPTLLVDFDIQGHCALSFGLPARSGVADWIVGELPLRDCLLTARPETVHLLPGDSRSKSVERLLYGDPDEMRAIVERLRGLDYVYVIIDTNPSGVLTETALDAADLVVMPFRPEPFALDGVMASTELVRQRNPQAQLIYLPVGFDARLNEHRHNLAAVREHLDVDDGLTVHQRVAVMEAQAYGQTIWEYKGSGIVDVRRAYERLAETVLVRIKNQEGSGLWLNQLGLI